MAPLIQSRGKTPISYKDMVRATKNIKNYTFPYPLSQTTRRDEKWLGITDQSIIKSITKKSKEWIPFNFSAKRGKELKITITENQAVPLEDYFAFVVEMAQRANHDLEEMFVIITPPLDILSKHAPQQRGSSRFSRGKVFFDLYKALNHLSRD